MVLLIDLDFDIAHVTQFTTQAAFSDIIIIDDTYFHQVADAQGAFPYTELSIIATQITDNVIDITLQEDSIRSFVKYVCSKLAAGYVRMGKTVVHFLRSSLHPTICSRRDDNLIIMRGTKPFRQQRSTVRGRCFVI